MRKKLNNTTNNDDLNKIEILTNLLQENDCNIKLALSKANIKRTEYNKLLTLYPEFEQTVNDIQESNIDVVESVLLNKIKTKQDSNLIMFYLRTKGKHRGYNEKAIDKEKKETAPTIQVNSKETKSNIVKLQSM